MRPQRWAEWFELFFNPRVPLAFLVGSIALGIAGSAAYALLIELFGDNRTGRLLLLSCAVLALTGATLIVQQAISLWTIRKNQGRYVVSSDQLISPQRGLILPVGLRDDGPEWAIIEHHTKNATLRHCWLLASHSMLEKRKISDLRAYLNERNASVVVLSISDPYSLQDCYEQAREALKLARNSGALPLAIDITGGTSIMSVGLALAASEYGVDIQYLPATYNAAGRVNTDSSSVPILAKFVSSGRAQP